MEPELVVCTVSPVVVHRFFLLVARSDDYVPAKVPVVRDKRQKASGMAGGGELWTVLNTLFYLAL